MKRQPIDWSQLWYPGRKLPFTPEEMAQAGSDAPSPTMVAVACVNFVVPVFVALQLAPTSQTARLSAIFAALAVLSVPMSFWTCQICACVCATVWPLLRCHPQSESSI